jgi:hypothetical protein
MFRAVFPNQGSQEPWSSTEHRQGFLEKSWNIYIENIADLYIKFS